MGGDCIIFLSNGKHLAISLGNIRDVSYSARIGASYLELEMAAYWFFVTGNTQMYVRRGMTDEETGVSTAGVAPS